MANLFRYFVRFWVRLTAIGEASGSLGPLIARYGRMEDAALRRIEAAGLIVPAVIAVLSGFFGVIMGVRRSDNTEANVDNQAGQFEPSRSMRRTMSPRNRMLSRSPG